LKIHQAGRNSTRESGNCKKINNVENTLSGRYRKGLIVFALRANIRATPNICPKKLFLLKYLLTSAL